MLWSAAPLRSGGSSQPAPPDRSSTCTATRRSEPHAALPYATAKSAIERPTGAVAVDLGPPGIRANAVALGSIITEWYEGNLAQQDSEQAPAVSPRSMPAEQRAAPTGSGAG